MGMAKHLVGLGYLAEAGSGIGLSWVGIRMGVMGQAPVRTGDLIVTGAGPHLQPDVEPVTIAMFPGGHYLS